VVIPGRYNTVQESARNRQGGPLPLDSVGRTCVITRTTTAKIPIPTARPRDHLADRQLLGPLRPPPAGDRRI